MFYNLLPVSTATILLELQYFAPIQYYTKLLAYANIQIEQHENYSKGSFRNRCHIATANGAIALSIPLKKGKNQQTNIRAIGIDNTTNWQLSHWRSIATAYGKSPYFEYYQDDLKAFFETSFDTLFDCCWAAQQLVLELLQFEPPIVLTNSFVKNPEGLLDFRNKIRPKSYLEPQDEHFVPTPYPQVFADRLPFLPNLSILDMLFCAGPEALHYLQQSISTKAL